MTDAYRSAGFRCPRCPASPLRPYGRRLICDECHGILLAVDDFASQLATREAVRVVEGREAAQTCPRCLRPMRCCAIHVGKRAVAIELVRCASDGIWFHGDSLAEIYAMFESKAAVSGRGSYGGPPGGGYGRLLNAGFQTSYQGRPKKLPPRVHSALVPPSEFRERRLACPNDDCGRYPLQFEATRWSCPQCRGSFVENAALEVLVSEMALAPWQLPPSAGRGGSRQCPICREALAVEDIEGAQIDRCAEHGVWFDPTELEAVLQQASGAAAYDGGVGGWLRRMFSRGPREA